MDAVHFTLEAFTCHVWCKKPLYLKTGAGRNRFNLLGCVDPFSLDIIQSHSMIHVDADQTKAFLEKVRQASGDTPVSIVLDNARYQHCQAVKDKATELGIDLIFLPPYSPNLNIIERLWKLIGWSAKRELSKINYRIHTDAIKHNLIPAEITKAQASIIYANEADVLNVAMFGMTAKQWREANPDLKGNIRDYASVNELICLSNMENLNAVFIEHGMPLRERLIKLNQIAIHQMSVLERGDNDRRLLK